MLNDEEYNKLKEEYIQTHICRQMRKQCKMEFFQLIKDKKFDYSTFQVFTDLVFLTIEAIKETIVNEGR